jgi:uncharacterized HAD superfamily protein
MRSAVKRIPLALYPFEAEARLNNIYAFSRTEKETPHFTITKINWLTLVKYNHHSALKGQRRALTACNSCFSDQCR